jgi:hypothetical protein
VRVALRGRAVSFASQNFNPRCPRWGGGVLVQQVLNDPQKPRCEASCQRLHGTEVVIIVSQKFLSGHREAPRRMCAIQSHGSAGGDCLIPPFLWG